MPPTPHHGRTDASDFPEISQSLQDILLPVTVSAAGGILLNPRHLTLCSAKPFYTLSLHHHSGSTYTPFFKQFLVLVSMWVHSSLSIFWLFFLSLLRQLLNSNPTIKCRCSSESHPRPSTLCSLHFPLRKHHQFPWLQLSIHRQIPNEYLWHRSHFWVTDLSMELPTGYFSVMVSKATLKSLSMSKTEVMISASYLSMWLHYSSSCSSHKPGAHPWLLLLPHPAPIQSASQILDTIYPCHHPVERVSLATSASVLVPGVGVSHLWITCYQTLNWRKTITSVTNTPRAPVR